MRINIGDVNYRNFDNLEPIAATAGFACSIKCVDDCNYYIETGSPKEYKAAGISQKEIKQMIGEFVIHGFKVSVEW